jgi:hypothetical protein
MIYNVGIGLAIMAIWACGFIVGRSWEREKRARILTDVLLGIRKNK